MRSGDRATAIGQVRGWLAGLGLLGSQSSAQADPELFDAGLHRAVLAFQQQRGLTVDGVVGPETFAALEGARWALGDRVLHHRVGHPFVGDDVLALQHRLTELGFDVGRCDGVFGAHTSRGVREFQRNYGLRADGTCGPLTLRALRRLRRSVVGGRPRGLREAEVLRLRGPSLADKVVVLDAGHGGDDAGWVAHGLCERDVVADTARRLEGRLAATGATAYLTHGPGGSPSETERAAFANETDADVLISLHCDGAASTRPEGVATYFYGTGRDTDSATGDRLADLVQREVLARTDFRDCRHHPKAWELLRLTRMPAIRVELGYLTNAADAARVGSEGVREAVAEAVLVALQRLYLPREQDYPTGVLRLPLLLAEG